MFTVSSGNLTNSTSYQTHAGFDILTGVRVCVNVTAVDRAGNAATATSNGATYDNVSPVSAVLMLPCFMQVFRTHLTFPRSCKLL